MIEIRALRMFVALADDLHFARTADRLNVAQSVLSTQIKRLEDIIGTTLLYRRKRAAVSLTRAGEILLEEARGAIAGIDRVERIGRLASLGEVGPLNLGYIFSAAVCGLLPGLFGMLQKNLPLLRVRSTLLETPEQITAIADARLDLGLIRPRPVYPANVSADIVHTETMLVAMAATHRLASKPAISPADFAGERFINPQFHADNSLGVKLTQLAEIGDFDPGPVDHVSDFVTAACMAAGGYGIVLAPRSLSNIAIKDLIFREIAGYPETLDIAVAYRTDDPSPLADTMRRITHDLRAFT